MYLQRQVGYFSAVDLPKQLFSGVAFAKFWRGVSLDVVVSWTEERATTKLAVRDWALGEVLNWEAIAKLETAAAPNAIIPINPKRDRNFIK